MEVAGHRPWFHLICFPWASLLLASPDGSPLLTSDKMEVRIRKRLSISLLFADIFVQPLATL